MKTEKERSLRNPGTQELSLLFLDSWVPKRSSGATRGTSCILLSALLALPASFAHAQDACEAAAPMEGQRLLRRLSLDLRGRVPGREDIAAQEGKTAVDAATIDGWLRSPELLEVMRRYHAELLWPNIDQVELIPQQNVLMPIEVAPGDTLWLSPLRSVFARTISGPLYGLCKNEPAQFDASGKIIAEPYLSGAGEILSYQEGYVMVEPWWAPGTEIKVCGFDAQPATRAVACPGPAERYPFLSPTCDQVQAYAGAVGVPFAGAEVDCSSLFGFFAPGCGCGPNLRYCQSTETEVALKKSLLEQELRMVDQVIAEDRPYHQVLTEKTVEMNGPIALYLREQSRLSFDLFADPDASSPIADVAPNEADRWVPVTRGGRHSGVLTTPGYLLRFQSNRGRAHRFYNAFECSTFIPGGALPSPFEACSKHEDLTQRCGCDSCHKSLEPMAAAWGRFSEYGFAPIDDARFPSTVGASCAAPFASLEAPFRCGRFYELEPVGEEAAYAGMLNSYVFRTPDQIATLETGPRALVDRAIASGSFATCTVRRMWTHFMRRAPTADEELGVIPELRDAFVADGYKLRGLIASIVEQPAYRRLP